ncbi:MAG: hypothetical protein SV775_17830, partial [Thermodesulfobacteriota bacterium]|nr:hypothetical protein [Thermodesulfobacteriota bacterium]
SSAYKLQAKVYNQQQKPVAAFDALKTYIAHNPDDQEAQGLLAVVGPAKRAPSVEPIAEQLKAEPFERELQIEPVEEELGAEPFEEDLLEDALVQEKLVEGPIEEEVVELTEGEPAIEDPRGIEDLAPGAEEEREMFEGPSTPTIAEIYYDQGLVEEAITIYEQVLSDNPHDEASVKRLAELKAMIPGEEAVQIADADDLRGGKEKIIGILEAWRARILETGHA